MIKLLKQQRRFIIQKKLNFSITPVLLVLKLIESWKRNKLQRVQKHFLKLKLSALLFQFFLLNELHSN